MAQDQISAPASTLLATIRTRLKATGVLDNTRVEGSRFIGDASGSAEPAEYRVDVVSGAGGDEIWVSLVTDNRWLSESIESDLVHTGDKLEELLEEELVDLGWELGTLPYEHFRSDDMLFTFRSKMPFGPDRADAAEQTVIAVLGYEQCFRELGDMTEDEED